MHGALLRPWPWFDSRSGRSMSRWCNGSHRTLRRSRSRFNSWSRHWPCKCTGSHGRLRICKTGFDSSVGRSAKCPRSVPDQHATVRRSQTWFNSWRGRCNRLTLEPDGAATGCNPVQVGSIPTGVSDTAGPTAPVAPSSRRLVACVPYMGSDRRSCQLWLAQWIEHQTFNLAVVGSTPTPTSRLITCHQRGPREAGQRVIGHRRLSDRRRR